MIERCALRVGTRCLATETCCSSVTTKTCKIEKTAYMIGVKAGLLSAAKVVAGTQWEKVRGGDVEDA